MLTSSAGPLRCSCAFRLLATASLVVVFLLLQPAAVAAQIYTGRIDATVLDQTGGVLPGVTVDLSGQQTDSATTDAQGEVHFLNLAVGKYNIKAALSGFGEYLKEDIYVGAGGAIALRITMQVAAVGETVDVVGQGTLIQPRKQLIATNVSVDELQNVPTARDPWVVLQTVPGVVVDRVNVGGSESGQQSLFTAKGADFGENTWHLDGIPITDMTGIGSSPSYYDFDTLEEIQITTGGADAQVSTPGVHVNVILKAGTDTPRGGARVYFASDALQSDNLPDNSPAVAGSSGKGNRTDQYSDYGVEFGGPLSKKNLWAWGSLSRTDIRIRTLDNVADRSVLDNASLKITGQANPSTRLGFTYFRGNKTKEARFASPLNAPESTDSQDAPSAVYKGEASFVLGRSVFLTGRFAHATNTFTLDPKGGRDTQVYQDINGVFHNSFIYDTTDRPQTTALVDGNWFRGKHEVKFGASWRYVKSLEEGHWGGGVVNVQLEPDSPLTLAVVFRPVIVKTDGDYIGTYIGDTYTAGRLTAHAALRYDYTTNSALEARVDANPLAPDVLGAFTAPAIKNAITWHNFSPRVSAVYALDNSRKTIVRGSYAVFASQLGIQEAALASAATYAYVYYVAVDFNGNQATEPNEIVSPVLGAHGVDLSNPTKAVNRIDPDLTSPRTHEVVLGIDHEVGRNMLVSGSYTWRRVTNVLWSPLIGVRQDDYRLAGQVSGTAGPAGTYNVPYYTLNASAAPPGAGVERVNRDGYHRGFNGFEASLVKRLSNRWMARVGFALNNEREYFDNPSSSIGDPTPTPGSPLRDGGVVVRETSGIGKAAIYMITPRYQFTANGFWEGPWGINAAANVLSRQGFGKPYFSDVRTPTDPVSQLKHVLVVDDLDSQRLDPLTTVDLRFEKALALDRVNMLFDIDVFNVFNVSTALRQQYNVGATGTAGFDKVLEIVNPRIVRFGVRVKF